MRRHLHDVVVVGGGIAGLATAYELHRLNVPFVLLEGGPRAGGVILSEQIDDYTIDAGPDSLLVQKPDGIKLCEELGLGDRLVATKPPRLAFIQRGGRLHPLPPSSVLGIPTRIGPFIRTRLFSWSGKLRMGAELFVPPRRDDGDESIGAFMTRRFGAEAAAYLAEPLLAGIHAGNVDRLSVRSLFPRFADAERTHGSLLRAFRLGRSPRSASGGPEPDVPGVPPSRLRRFGEPGCSSHVLQAGEGRAPRRGEQAWTTRALSEEGAFRSLPGGLSELVRAIVAALPPDSIKLNTSVKALGGREPYRIEAESGDAFEARAVVLATPAFVTGRIVGAAHAELARFCEEVPYTSTATIALAFPRAAVAHPLNGSGFVVPRAEGTGILAGSWLSSKWPDRAPDDRVLLRAFVGGARDPKALERSDEELIARSLTALGPLLGIHREPLLARVYRWERASAQHEVGHLTRLAAIEHSLARRPGLFVTGSGFRGVGIPDCIADGRATARQVAQWLQTPSTC